MWIVTKCRLSGKAGGEIYFFFFLIAQTFLRSNAVVLVSNEPPCKRWTDVGIFKTLIDNHMSLIEDKISLYRGHIQDEREIQRQCRIDRDNDGREKSAIRLKVLNMALADLEEVLKNSENPGGVSNDSRTESGVLHGDRERSASRSDSSKYPESFGGGSIENRTDGGNEFCDCFNPMPNARTGSCIKCGGYPR